MFDECHRAKNLCPVGSSKPTKTGLTVLELQNKLPKSRVVYASATGASEPRNMAYMVRLGIWGEGTPFPEFTDFISAVEKRYYFKIIFMFSCVLIILNVIVNFLMFNLYFISLLQLFEIA